jgi:hypothetical protein
VEFGGEHENFSTNKILTNEQVIQTKQKNLDEELLDL